MSITVPAPRHDLAGSDRSVRMDTQRGQNWPLGYGDPDADIDRVLACDPSRPVQPGRRRGRLCARRAGQVVAAGPAGRTRGRCAGGSGGEPGGRLPGGRRSHRGRRVPVGRGARGPSVRHRARLRAAACRAPAVRGPRSRVARCAPAQRHPGAHRRRSRPLHHHAEPRIRPTRRCGLAMVRGWRRACTGVARPACRERPRDRPDHAAMPRARRLPATASDVAHRSRRASGPRRSTASHPDSTSSSSIDRAARSGRSALRAWILLLPAPQHARAEEIYRAGADLAERWGTDVDAATKQGFLRALLAELAGA